MRNRPSAAVRARFGRAALAHRLVFYSLGQGPDRCRAWPPHRAASLVHSSERCRCSPPLNEAKGFGYRDGRLERGAVEHLDGQGILVEVMQAVQVDRNGFLAALVGAVCE